jgi:hypothetical protein
LLTAEIEKKLLLFASACHYGEYRIVPFKVNPEIFNSLKPRTGEGLWGSFGGNCQEKRFDPHPTSFLTHLKLV